MATRVLDFPPSLFDPFESAYAVEGGSPARAENISSLQAVDRIFYSQGRRVLAQLGLHGADAFLVKSIDPEDTPSQEYPEKDAERVMIRTRARLTPGFVLQVHVIYSPTGQTQYFLAEPSNSWFPDGAIGALLVDVTWSNPGAADQTTSTVIGLAPSGEQYAGIGGTPWKKTKTATSPLIQCAGMAALDAVWSEGTTVTITLTARGGARIIDAVVYEVQKRYVRDDTHREACAQLETDALYYPYAILGKDPPTDPRHGPRAAIHLADSRRNLTGPSLMQWSSWTENTEAVTATEATAVSITGITFKDVRFSTITSFDEANPGWSLSSGGTARLIETSGTQALRDVEGVIPVTCRVYARMTTIGATGTIRFQSQDYSLIDLEVNSSSWFWYEGLAWLRCGPHATVFSSMQILGKTGGLGTTLEVRYAAVDFGGHYTVIQ